MKQSKTIEILDRVNQSASVNKKTPSQSTFNYQDYVNNRQSQSKSVSLVCYNCINQSMSDTKQSFKKTQIAQDKYNYNVQTQKLLKQQLEEENIIQQKRIRDRDFLQRSYFDSKKYIEQKKIQQQNEEKQIVNQINQSVLQERDQIRKEILRQNDKKQQFIEGLNQQLIQRRVKTQENQQNGFFQIGDEEKTEQILSQKKQIERNLLKNQRDESIKMRESIQKVKEKEEKLQERKAVDYQAILDSQIKLAEKTKKLMIEKQCQKEIKQTINQQNEQKRIERMNTMGEYNKYCTKIDEMNIAREQEEQQLELKKKQIYQKELFQQNTVNQLIKAEIKKKEKIIDYNLSQINKKYEYLTKHLITPTVKPCNKCSRAYEMKCLSKTQFIQ